MREDVLVLIMLIDVGTTTTIGSDSREVRMGWKR